MGNVVYLFGAGASYGVRDKQTPRLDYSLEYRDYKGVHQEIKGSAPNIIEGLPVVSELPERMDYVRYLIKKEIKDFAIDAKLEASMFEDLEENLAWLQEASRGHATVDTFAKKLFLTQREDDYNRLKRTLSAYFMLEQLLVKVDKRYDAFLAAILGNDAKDLPQNIRILSWNYDIQLELSYSEYLQKNDLNEIEKSLLLFNKTIDINRYQLGNGFRIIKLNGSALMFDSVSRTIIDPFFFNKPFSAESIGQIATITQSKGNDCSLSFAWENAGDFFIDKVKKNIEDAETLVVIGYSFPYFNRTMDKILFQSMPGLKKIYLQDIDPDTIEQSVANLQTDSHTKVNKTKIEKKYHTQQFYLPPEL
jgi:hypothetical protein